MIVGVESHAVWHETGAAAAIGGVQLTEVGADGRFTADEFLAARNPRGPPALPADDARRGRGHAEPQGRARVGPRASSSGSARPRASTASRPTSTARGCSTPRSRAATTPAALAAPFDLVTIALSKGLGCPVGSVLAGTRADVDALVRYRRMLGGAMRQSGVLAAAGLHALEHHVERLAEDHANARLIGERLAACDGVALDLAALETNIVVFGLREGAPDAATVVARAAERDVQVMAFGPRTVRAVTHLDVGRDDCERAADALADAVA